MCTGFMWLGINFSGKQTLRMRNDKPSVSDGQEIGFISKADVGL